MKKVLPAITAIVFVLASGGCSRTLVPQEAALGIVFPNEWVGNIDKVEFNEPSGICWHVERQTLFIVGDEGDRGDHFHPGCGS